MYKNLRAKRETDIQESRQDPEKYQYEKCARSYKKKEVLTKHQKYICGVMLQFKSELCNKRCKLKSNLTKHINYVHHKTNSKRSIKVTIAINVLEIIVR